MNLLDITVTLLRYYIINLVRNTMTRVLIKILFYILSSSKVESDFPNLYRELVKDQSTSPILSSFSETIKASSISISRPVTHAIYQFYISFFSFRYVAYPISSFFRECNYVTYMYICSHICAHVSHRVHNRNIQ